MILQFLYRQYWNNKQQEQSNSVALYTVVTTS